MGRYNSVELQYIASVSSTLLQMAQCNLNITPLKVETLVLFQISYCCYYEISLVLAAVVLPHYYTLT